jgi:hypothetical protein
MRASALRFINQIREQVARAIGALDGKEGAHRFEPFLGLLRIRIVSHDPGHSALNANPLLLA